MQSCVVVLRTIEFKPSVWRELRRLERDVVTRIVDKIEKELGSAHFLPVPLVGPYKGLYKLRVGDYRVVYALSPDRVDVVHIAHRSDVYR